LFRISAGDTAVVISEQSSRIFIKVVVITEVPTLPDLFISAAGHHLEETGVSWQVCVPLVFDIIFYNCPVRGIYPITCVYISLFQ
jgi:hypothetical protein